MTAALNVLAVAGGAYRPSRTLILAKALIAELGLHLDIDARIVKLSEIARPLGSALSRSERTGDASGWLPSVPHHCLPATPGVALPEAVSRPFDELTSGAAPASPHTR
jgi:hypothetical protein